MLHNPFVFLGCILALVVNEIEVKYLGSKITADSSKYYVSSDKANFFQAFVNCRQGGMYLASIESAEDEENLEYALRDVDKSGGSPNGFWLSGTNLVNVDTFQYYWLSSGSRAMYTNWWPSQPDNANGIEHCLEWGMAAQGILGWNDYPCNSTLRYVCELLP